MNKELDKYMTVEEAAKFLGVKEGTVRDYLSDRKLTTIKFKSLTLLSKKEVERYKRPNVKG